MAFISSPLGHLPTSVVSPLQENTMTSDQLTKLKSVFCASVTDSMDIETLIEIVYEQLLKSYDSYDETDMQEEILSYFNDDGEEYNNLLREVTLV